MPLNRTARLFSCSAALFLSVATTVRGQRAAPRRRTTTTTNTAQRVTIESLKDLESILEEEAALNTTNADSYDTTTATSNDTKKKLDGNARIVGGTPVAAGTYPSYAFGAGGKLCGATLIHVDILLTAAHCNGAFLDGALFGGTLLDGSDSTRVNVDSEFASPDYDDASRVNDIMLVKLSEPYTAAPLATLNLNDATVPSEGQVLTVLGYGHTVDGGDNSPILLDTRVNGYTDEFCDTLYTVYEPTTMLCAGTEEGGRDSCQGDSGGPIFTEDLVQVGVVSTGSGCGVAQVPAIYTEVASFATFIRRGICDLSDSPPDSCLDPTATPVTAPTVSNTNNGTETSAPTATGGAGTVTPVPGSSTGNETAVPTVPSPTADGGGGGTTPSPTSSGNEPGSTPAPTFRDTETVDKIPIPTSMTPPSAVPVPTIDNGNTQEPSLEPPSSPLEPTGDNADTEQPTSSGGSGGGPGSADDTEQATMSLTEAPPGATTEQPTASPNASPVQAEPTLDTEPPSTASGGGGGGAAPGLTTQEPQTVEPSFTIEPTVEPIQRYPKRRPIRFGMMRGMRHNGKGFVIRIIGGKGRRGYQMRGMRHKKGGRGKGMGRGMSGYGKGKGGHEKGMGKGGYEKGKGRSEDDDDSNYYAYTGNRFGYGKGKMRHGKDRWKARKKATNRVSDDDWNSNNDTPRFSGNRIFTNDDAAKFHTLNHLGRSS